MGVQVLGFPTNLGIPKPVARTAPAALRELGLMRRLSAVAGPVRDLGDMDLPRGEHFERGEPLLRAVLAAARRQADIIRRSMIAGALPVTIGGDHSTSLGTVMGLHQAGLEFDVVWVDAHADFNTPRTSPSGNPHGMVLAMLAGLTPHLPRILPPHRAHILGARDLDPGEKELARTHGLNVYSPAEALDRLDTMISSLGPRVFLSFDMDSLAPEVAPGVRTPVPGGFSLDQALQLVRHIARARDLVALDLVEYYPDLDREQRTAKAALTVLETALAGRRVHSELAAGGTR